MTTGRETTPIAKVDLTRELDGYRARAGEFRELVLPPRRYLAIDGAGDPNTAPAYAEALAALYPLAYAVKFAARRELGRDHVVPPLEGLWWADDMAAFTGRRDKSRWSWRMLSLVPEWVPDALVEVARTAVAEKSGRGSDAAPERLHEVQVIELDEGRCIQTLHVGGYDDEAPVLARLHDEIIPAAGPQMSGRHHEIYLGDHRRVAPDRRRTILRQPVSGAAPNHPDV